MEHTKLSVIVPVYNARATLDRCISSLTAQSYPYIEIILVDDGSKDDSLEICWNYARKDPRIKMVSKQNGGVSSARNAGLDIAQGEFVMFCDSDDWVDETWCETMLVNYSPENLVMCAYNCHYADGTSRVVGCDETRFPKNEYLRLLHLGAFAPWNKLYNASVIADNQIRFPQEVSLGEDKLFVWRYLKCIEGDITYVNEPLNHYVFSAGSSLSASLPKEYYRQCLLIASEILKDIHDGVPCSEEALSAFMNDTYYQIEGALSQIMNNGRYSAAHRAELCSRIMNHECVREVLNGSGVAQRSVIGFCLKHKSLLGLRILKLFNKI